MTEKIDPAIVITGASGGIGEELAYRFAVDAKPLVLVARSAAELERVAQTIRDRNGARVETLSLDVSEPTAPEALAEALAGMGLGVHTLVNNAGFGDIGPFAEMAPDRATGMIDLNVRALTALSRRFLPEMIGRGEGGLLNVASTAAFMPGPFMAVYYATKAFVRSFSEALSKEVEGTGVIVTALCPGPVATGFQKEAQMEDARLVKMAPMMSAGKVAEIGYDGFKRGKRVVVPGFSNKVMASSAAFTPRAVLLPLVKYLQT